MTKRALLIGSPVDGLARCDTDLGFMKEALQGHGFEDIDERRDQGAVRDGIREGYRALIEASDEGDVALVDHRATGRLPGTPRPASPAAARSFTGASSRSTTINRPKATSAASRIALHVARGSYTAKTANVTVILDCCHAARMSRDIRARRPRALRDPRADRRREALRGLLADRARLARVDVESNPLAVRLVACGPDDSAWEYAIAPDRIGGVFTEAVARALRDPGASGATWESIGRSVRDCVTGIFPCSASRRGGARASLPVLRESGREGRAAGRERPPGRCGVARRPAARRARRGCVNHIDSFHRPRTSRLPAASCRAWACGVGAHGPTGGRHPGGGICDPGADGASFPDRRARGRAEWAALARAVEESPLVRLASQEEPPLATLAVDAGRLAIPGLCGRPPGRSAAPRRSGPDAPHESPLDRDGQNRGSGTSESPRSRRATSPLPGESSRTARCTIGPCRASGSGAASPSSCASRTRARKPSIPNVFDVGLSQKVDRLSDSAPGGWEVKSGDFRPVCSAWTPRGKRGAGTRAATQRASRASAAPARPRPRGELRDHHRGSTPRFVSPLEAPAVRGGLEPARRSLTELESRFAQLFQGTTHATRTAKVIAPTGGCRVVRIDFYLSPRPPKCAPSSMAEGRPRGGRAR